MTTHAESQRTTRDIVERLLATLNDPAFRASLHLERAMAVSTQEMLGRWSIRTPDGPLHRVAVVRVVDGEPSGFDEFYESEADAVAVWEHLAAASRGD